MEIKVKLVAIAKDEAAYLPEWIQHHLYFGFDFIEIHVNNTSDNTWDLAKLYANESRVSFIDSDKIFSTNHNSPQHEIYLNSYLRASGEGYSHVMFLDIDEFWTPQDLTSSIKLCLNEIKTDVICFEWLNRIETQTFGKAVDNITVRAEHHNLVKSVVVTGLPLLEINLHNITSPGKVRHSLADGTAAKFKQGKQQIIDELKFVKNYFIIHRMFRSQIEYVSLLGRGRPANVHNTSSFKNNRDGYCVVKNQIIDISFSEHNLSEYHKILDLNLSSIPNEMTRISHDFVHSRFESILKMIEHAEICELETIKKVLTNVTDHKVCCSYSAYLNKVIGYISSNGVDLMRDGAIALERRDINKAYRLMSLAGEIRPSGKLIQNKLKDYRAVLKG